MFVVRTIKRNILKHWKKSILSILLSGMIVLFLLLYIENMERNKAQLIKLGETIPVTVRVCNIDGSQEVGLQIDFEKLQKIQESGFVTDEVITMQVYADLASSVYDDEEPHRPAFSYVGSNSFSAFTAFSAKDVSYMDNYDESFLRGDDGVCIVRYTFMKDQKLQPGDMLELEGYASEYNEYGGISFQSLGKVKLKVIGSYDTGNMYGSDELPDILSPIGFIASIFKGTEASRYASSARFTLKEPLKINEFKDQMQELGFKSIDMLAGFTHNGKALTINDETFIRSAIQLTESLKLLQGLAPMIFIIVVVIGFIVSYLLMQSRRNEFAIMRSLGTGRIRSFVIIILENLILVLSGYLFGAVVSFSIISVRIMTMGLIMVTFLSFYMLGTAIALLLLNRFSVMAILSKTD